MKIKKENIFLVLVIVVMAWFSFWCLEQNPPSWFDEGIYHQITRNLATVGEKGMQLAPGEYSDFSLISVGYPVFYPAAQFFKFFGDGINVLRLIAVAYLFGFVLVLYALAKRLYGIRAALWSATLLVTFSPLYGHGKNFLGELPGLFYFALGLWFLTLMESGRRKYLNALLGGLFLGLAVASKPVYLLIIPAAGLAAVFKYRNYLKDKIGRKLTGLVLFGLIMTFLLWIFNQFGGGTGLARVLEHYNNPNNLETSNYVLSNLIRFVTESTPMHFFFLLLAVVAYLAWKKVRNESVQLAEVIIVLFSLLIFGSYLRTVGWYRYLFPAQALLLLLLPPAVAKLSVIFKYFRARQHLAVHLVCALVLLAQFIPLKQERLMCREDVPTYYENKIFLEYLQDKNNSFFFYNLPHLAVRLGEHQNYFQYARMNDILDFGSEHIFGVAEEKYNIIVVPDTEVEVIKKIPACYQERNNYGGVLLFAKTAACLK